MTQISAKERDLLYEEIRIQLSGIGDVWLAIGSEDFEAAELLGRRFCDQLRLVLDDLGLGDGNGKSIALTTPPDVLRRAFSYLSKLAEDQERIHREEASEALVNQEESRRLLTTCQRLLGDIGS